MCAKDGTHLKIVWYQESTGILMFGCQLLPKMPQWPNSILLVHWGISDKWQ